MLTELVDHGRADELLIANVLNEMEEKLKTSLRWERIVVQEENGNVERVAVGRW